MRAGNRLAGGVLAAALAWGGAQGVRAEATVVRIIEGVTAWGALHDTVADPGNDRVAVVGYAANSVGIHEISTGRLVRTVAAGAVLSLAADSGLHRIYAAQQYSGVRVIDSTTGDVLHEVTPPQGGGAVHDLVVDSVTHRVYMTRDGGPSPHGLNDLQVLVMGPSGSNPYADLGSTMTGMTGNPWSRVALDATRGRLYVMRGGNTTCRVLDAGTLATVATIPLGSTGSGMAVDEATGRVYVAMGAAGLAVIDGTIPALLRTLPVSAGNVSCNPATGRVYASHGGQLRILDAATEALLEVLSLPGEHFGMDVDRATGNVLVHAGPEANGKIYVVADPVPPPVPAAPTGLSATALNGTQVALAWTDASGNETGFEVQRAEGAGPFATVSMLGPNDAAFTDTGLANLTTYSYRVRAVNAAGSSAFSNTASATTPDTTAPVLSAPAAVTLVTDCAGASLAITPSALGVSATDNGGAAPTLVLSPSSVLPGTTSVVCTATDGAGNAAAATVAVTVLRGAFTVTIQKPLEVGVDNLVKSGQTVPLKVTVACGSAPASGITVLLDGVDALAADGSTLGNALPEDSGLANDGGNTFRLADGQHVFNLSTKGWSGTSGARFRVRMKVVAPGHVDTLAEVVLKNR
jgi:hypothetical protein